MRLGGVDLEGAGKVEDAWGFGKNSTGKDVKKKQSKASVLVCGVGAWRTMRLNPANLSSLL